MPPGLVGESRGDGIGLAVAMTEMGVAVARTVGEDVGDAVRVEELVVVRAGEGAAVTAVPTGGGVAGFVWFGVQLHGGAPGVGVPADGAGVFVGFGVIGSGTSWPTLLIVQPFACRSST